MSRFDFERLSKDELIELVLRLQRPAKTSRTSSKPPSTDRKERREKAKPGGAKPGHEGHSRRLSEDVDKIVDHHPDECPCCRMSLSSDLPAEVVSEHDKVELPATKPFVERHRRLAVRCPSCGTIVVAPVPAAAKGTPFGPRLHAVATYFKTFQALRARTICGRARRCCRGPAPSQSGRLGRDRRPHRGQQFFSLGVPLQRRRGSSGVADAGRRGDPGHDGGTRPAVWLSDCYSAQQGGRSQRLHPA